MAGFKHSTGLDDDSASRYDEEIIEYVGTYLWQRDRIPNNKQIKSFNKI